MVAVHNLSDILTRVAFQSSRQNTKCSERFELDIAIVIKIYIWQSIKTFFLAVYIPRETSYSCYRQSCLVAVALIWFWLASFLYFVTPDQALQLSPSLVYLRATHDFNDRFKCLTRTELIKFAIHRDNSKLQWLGYPNFVRVP